MSRFKSGFSLVLLLIIIAVLAVTAFFGTSLFKNNISQTKQNVSVIKEETNSPTPTSIDKSDVKEQILLDIVSTDIKCDSVIDGKTVTGKCSVDMVSGNFAKGKMPMSYWIAEKNNGKWKVIITGNGIPNCSEIDKYGVPKEIFGNCIEAKGTLRY